jgi:hypothetical protein
MVDQSKVDQEKKVMIAVFESHQEIIKTNDPAAEVKRLIGMYTTSILTILYDGKIIYTKNV